MLVYICGMLANVATFVADHFASFYVLFNTGIIPFSRLGGFYANLGSAEIFLPPKKGVLSTNGK